MTISPPLAAAAVGLAVVLLLTVTVPHVGVTWDEPAYIVASESYAAWLGLLASSPSQALQPAAIAAHWRINREHPPLDKVWSGIVWLAARHVFDDLAAHRMGNILLAGGLAAMLFLFVAAQAGRIAGLMAVLSLFTMPRFFLHAHLAALDLPAAAMVCASLLLFWLMKDRPRFGWDVLLGVVWGLALATKVNALLVPPALLAWTVAFQRRGFLFRRLAVMLVVGTLLFVGLWPWLYDDFRARVAWYLQFLTVHHWRIGQYYLGRIWMPPPWHFPFVMVLAVTPITILLACLAGSAWSLRSPAGRKLGAFLVLGALVPLVTPVLTRSLIYDNDRLFVPAFPFVAALAGIGFTEFARGLGGTRRLQSLRPARRRALAIAGAVLLLAPQIVAAGRLYPFLLSYYSESVGGVAGAARLRLETTYWCETYAAALPFLNARARPGDVVWVDPWSYEVMLYYQSRGRLRRDLKVTGPEGMTSLFARQGVTSVAVELPSADLAVIQYRQTGLRDEVRAWLRGREPAIRLERCGAPLMEIYERR